MTGIFGSMAAWLRYLLILTVFLVVAWPDSAAGQSRSGLTNRLDYRLQAAAGDQCIQAINRVQGDVLVNHCNECRNATIQYQRRSGGFPITREFRVPEKGKVELSFKGSGKTRVVADTPCTADTQAETADVKDCAKLGTRKDGEPALINACPICRGVVIERVASNGRRERQTFTISPRTLIPLQLKGAANIQIIKELPCKK